MRVVATMFVFLVLAASLHAESGLPLSAPGDVGMDGDKLREIDNVVKQGIADGNLRGAVVVIGRRGRIVHRQAYGLRQVEPEPEAMTVETLFDLASLTKPIATGTSVLLLIEQGKIDPAAPVSRDLPEFGNNGKEEITVEQLLTHVGGLIADNPLRDYLDGRDKAFERINQLQLVAAPGERFIYSDVSFLVLGRLVEQVSGETLDRFTRKRIYEPLKMQRTGYCPEADQHADCAPTEKRNGAWIRGEVHDPRAWALGGVAGHAGLFSTADDLARYAQMLLNEGELDGVRVLQPETVRQMFVSRPVPRGVRTWGWDRRTGYSINRGETMSERALGHGGFTGTGIWIDPELDLFVIFLSSRLHPDGKGNVNRLIGRVGTIAADAIINRP